MAARSEIAGCVASFIDFPPMQAAATFNLEAVKEKVMKAAAHYAT